MRTFFVPFVLTAAFVPAQAADLRLAQIRCEGASILADSDSRTYYLYTAGSEGGVLAYKSKNLAGWDGPSLVLQSPEARDPNVFAYRGRTYLSATVSDKKTVIARPPGSWRVNTAQGTRIFAGTSPTDPFTEALNGGKSFTPADSVALGGTLYVEGDLVWLVYVHDWTQVVDSSLEAVRLKADLSAPVGEPIYLFKASDAFWPEQQTSRDPRTYPAAGPCLSRTRNGGLVLIWASAKTGRTAVSVARSVTGGIRGPWKQDATLLVDGGIPGSIFRAFDGRLMMVLHRRTTATLVELEDTGGTLRIRKPVSARKD